MNYTNLAFIKRRLAATVSGRGESLVVHWVSREGEVDETTGAVVGSRQPVSGLMSAVVTEEGVRMELRRWQEIQAGDLIMDVLPGAPVEIFAGQAESGVVGLASLSDQGVQVEWDGRRFAPQKLSEELASVMAIRVQGDTLLGRVVFRPAV